MGTTIAGNQHIGTNTKKMQYVWAPGLGGDNLEVELYEQDGIFTYQFNPTYDQRDDGVLAVEFYYYYRKPTTQAFWDYCYYADDFYIYPFLAWYDDTSSDGGKWGGIITLDSESFRYFLPDCAPCTSALTTDSDYHVVIHPNCSFLTSISKGLVCI